MRETTQLPKTETDMGEEIMAALAEVKRNTLLAAKNVLTLNDVALLTGLGKSYLYRLTSNKEIPHYKPNGKLVYFDRVEVEAWMKQNRIGTQDEAERKAVAAMARAEAQVEAAPKGAEQVGDVLKRTQIMRANAKRGKEANNE